VLQGVPEPATTFFKRFSEKIGGEACTFAAALYEEGSNFEERTTLLAGTAAATLAQTLVGQPAAADNIPENCSSWDSRTVSVSSPIMCT
jgi:hypothetical protein